MMQIQYRELSALEAAQIAVLRIALLSEVTRDTLPEDYEQLIQKKIVRNLDSGNALAFGAFDGADMVATAMLCRYSALPDETDPSGEGAVLCNVYTVPAYRGHGIMKQLLTVLLEKACAEGIREVILNAEKEAESLYTRMGFQPMSGAMVRILK